MEQATGWLQHLLSEKEIRKGTFVKGRRHESYICSVTITLYFLHFAVGNFCRFVWLDDCIISRNLAACVFVRVSFWHRRSQSAGASTSHSHHLQCKDMFTMIWIKTLWQRQRVGETTLISAFQLPLLGTLMAIPHQANATVIQFVRLYRKYAKYIIIF